MCFPLQNHWNNVASENDSFHKHYIFKKLLRATMNIWIDIVIDYVFLQVQVRKLWNNDSN